MIPYGKQDINQQDVDAVVDVLKSDFLTQGPKVPEFEKSVADYCKAEYAIAVNSATSALHLACLALDVRAGDLVWTSAISFVASANCALYCGADIDFVDIDPVTFNIGVEQLSEKLAQAKQQNCLPKVLIVVHLAGQPCDMKAIHELSVKYGFCIIEDASHAIGSRYQGRNTGSCEFSDIAVFSFHPVKIITTAEGGMAVTNNASLAQKMKLLSSHGVTRDPELFENQSTGSWYYEQIALGFNYRMTDIQAALGISQMQRLDAFVEKRNKLAQAYQPLLSELAIDLPQVGSNSYSSYHLYIIQLHESDRHKQVFEGLRKKGIGVNLHYMPIYNQPYFQRLGFKAGHCPNAEHYASRAISLPMHPGLTDAEMNSVARALAEELEA